MTFKKISSNHSHRICPSFLVAALIFSVFTLTGIVSAAWVDAPNEPPGYGASGCSPFPCLEEDFKPFNLSSTFQAKQGAIGAWEFRDSNDSTYYIDPSGEGIAGRFKGSFAITNGIMSVGRADALSGAHAKFVVNMPETTGKTGSFGDAIYAYSDSTTNPDTDGNGIPDGAAISVEQGNASGYALYSSGGINYFGGNVGIGTQTPTEKLDVVGKIKGTELCIGNDCKATWPSGYTPGMTIYSSPGFYSFTVPPGVYYLNVRVWGGGGGGGYGIYTRNYDSTEHGFTAGGGGGAGGYSESKWVSVTPGDVYSIAVGAGGSGGARPTTIVSTTVGETGGTSSFNGPSESITTYGGEGGIGFEFRYTGGEFNGIVSCNPSPSKSGGNAVGGRTNIPGPSGGGCVGAINTPSAPADVPGGAQSVATDPHDYSLPFLFGKGGNGHAYTVHPFTSNPETNANPGNGGGVIVWW